MTIITVRQIRPTSPPPKARPQNSVPTPGRGKILPITCAAIGVGTFVWLSRKYDGIDEVPGSSLANSPKIPSVRHIEDSFRRSERLGPISRGELIPEKKKA